MSPCSMLGIIILWGLSVLLGSNPSPESFLHLSALCAAGVLAAMRDPMVENDRRPRLIARLLGWSFLIIAAGTYWPLGQFTVVALAGILLLFPHRSPLVLALAWGMCLARDPTLTNATLTALLLAAVGVAGGRWHRRELKSVPKDYRQTVRALPRPTPEQCEEFVQYLCSAHSWYKHLPIEGRAMVVFLDPHAGDGFTDERPRFHYSWKTTAEYRRRFGYLDYGDPGALPEEVSRRAGFVLYPWCHENAWTLTLQKHGDKLQAIVDGAPHPECDLLLEWAHIDFQDQARLAASRDAFRQLREKELSKVRAAVDGLLEWVYA